MLVALRTSFKTAYTALRFILHDADMTGIFGEKSSAVKMETYIFRNDGMYEFILR